ncbi:MAG: mannose-6-phosphate isomerase [Ruminococcaceae bacterium]|nr:mannose-6-phosphate isomerase [Oscillospiraceae bacterium]
MQRYPLKLIPAVKEIIWGGDKLKKFYNKKADFDKLAESWELTVRPDGMSVIGNGEYAGMELGEYIEKAGMDVIAKGYDGDRFPLLIKFIDARDSLSIQVHPNDEYSLPHENEYGKTEIWYIVEAEEGAELVFGLTEDYTPEAFDKAIAENNVESLLGRVKVHPGEVYFIPAGLVHAIGAGTLICEIQQNSNVTYRVYDYGRLGKDGKPRELHVEKAKEAIINHRPEDVERLRFAAAKERTPTLLASCDKFNLNRYEFTEQTLTADETSFLSLTFIEGSGVIEANGASYPFDKGDTYYIPAGMGEFSMKSTGAVCIAASL